MRCCRYSPELFGTVLNYILTLLWWIVRNSSEPIWTTLTLLLMNSSEPFGTVLYIDAKKWISLKYFQIVTGGFMVRNRSEPFWTIFQWHCIVIVRNRSEPFRTFKWHGRYSSEPFGKFWTMSCIWEFKHISIIGDANSNHVSETMFWNRLKRRWTKSM